MLVSNIYADICLLTMILIDADADWCCLILIDADADADPDADAVTPSNTRSYTRGSVPSSLRP